MKKIIRLTESDLARIVKRVIMEQTISGTGTKEDPYKLKVFRTQSDKDSNMRSSNIDVYNLKIVENIVRFYYEGAGTIDLTNRMKYGEFTCDSGKVRIDEFGDDCRFSDEGQKLFQSKCDAYASTGSKPQSMAESRRYR